MKRRTRLALLSLFLGSLNFISLPIASASPVYSFTNASATGAIGPTQSQVNSAYSSTSLSGAVTVSGSGVQQWTVPTTGNYSFEVVGAHGAASTGASNSRGGKAAMVTATKNLVAGSVLYIVVGQAGTANGFNGGGGGASFVSVGSRTETTNVIVAGGGGGTREGATVDGGDASTTSAGKTALSCSAGTGSAAYSNTSTSGDYGATATLANGGRVCTSWGDSGSGWSGDGLDDGYGGGTVARSLSGSATGGSGGQPGGFGGGGAGGGSNGGGGGGGYTGGNGGFVAGGGGSFTNGFTSVSISLDTDQPFLD